MKKRKERLTLRSRGFTSTYEGNQGQKEPGLEKVWRTAKVSLLKDSEQLEARRKIEGSGGNVWCRDQIQTSNPLGVGGNY